MRALIASTALAAALVVAMPVLAQEQPQQEQSAAAPTQVSPNAHSLIDKQAMSEQGKEIGKVKDVLISPDGKVAAMVIDHQNKNRAVPWDQVSIQGAQITVRLSEQQLSQLPEYKSESD